MRSETTVKKNWTASKPRVIAIDDDLFYLQDLELRLKNDYCLKSYVGPSEFFAQCDQETIVSAEFALVDFDYTHTNALQLKIAKHFKDHGFKGKIILWSLLGDFPDEEKRRIQEDYDYFITKEEFSSSFLDEITRRPLLQ